MITTKNYGTMKTTSKKMLVLSMLALIVSCRVTPQDESLAGENFSSKDPVSVKINFSNVEWGDEINESPMMAENNSWGGG